MSDKDYKQRAASTANHDGATNEFANDEFANDEFIKAALQKWSAPAVSSDFDRRMFAAYRHEVNSNAELAHALSTPQAATASIVSETSEVAHGALAGSQDNQKSEDSIMKYCSTCKEEFAEKFTYCPTDGTPLTAEATAIGNTNDTAASPRQMVTPLVAAEGASRIVNRANGKAREVNKVSSNDFGAQTYTNGNVPNDFSPNGEATNRTNRMNNGMSNRVNNNKSLAPRGEYHLTIIEEAGIVKRLSREMGEVAHASQLTYPEFKRDPAGFTKRLAVGYGTYARDTFKQPNVAIGAVAGVLMMALIIGIVLALGSMQPRTEIARDKVRDDVDYIGEFQDIPEEEPEPPEPDKAIGQSESEGKVGFQKGTGQGSLPQPKPATGGGGGGREEPTPASRGQVPPASLDQPQIVTPKPEPPKIQNPTLPVAVVSKGDPLLFPEKVTGPFGDPNSRNTTPSSGGGRGDGIGNNGSGNNVGDGEGGGYGRGRGGNIGGGDFGLGGGGRGGGTGAAGGAPVKAVYSAREVTSKAQILTTVEAPYTEEARKNQINGVVKVRVVLGANGEISGISPVQRLPYGLTEQAIAYAKRVKFKPATKDGRPVSQYAVLNFTFNMY